MLLGGKGCQQCACTSGCTSKTLAGYDNVYIDTAYRAGAVRIGPFASNLTVTSVTIPTDGLIEPLTSPPAAGTKPTMEIWSHDATNNLPLISSGPVKGIVATLTSPATFGAGNWVFTHAGYTLTANTYYWLVCNNVAWGYWDEHCAANDAACEAACCDYWTAGLGTSVIWDGTAFCGAYVYTLN